MRIRQLLFLTFFFFSLPLLAQDTLQIDTVAVRAGRASGAAARMVTRISAADMAALPVHSADDHLDYIPWVDLRSRGNNGVQGNLSIRGAGYEQTLILLDGVPMADAQTGHHNLNLPLPVEMVGGMEVIASGASRIFGPKAMAGAVNFTTRLPESNRAWGSLFGGDFGFYRAAAGFSLNKNGWGFGLSGQSLGSKGYISNTDFNHNNLFLQLYRKNKLGRFWINAMGGKKRFGAQNFYSANFPFQQEYTTTGIATLNWEFSKGPWEFYGNAHMRYHHDRFELYREGAGWYSRVGNRYVRGTDTTPTWYTGHNYHRSGSYGLMLNATRKLGVHRISLGAEARNEWVMSNVLGEPMSSPVRVPFGPEGAVFTRSADRQNISLFAEDRVEWKKWLISGGVLVNQNSMFGTDVYPGLELARRLPAGWKLFASANRANRFPTYTDLYYNRGGAMGSKDLNPETAMSYELGSEWRRSRHFLRVAAFARNGRNMIDWVRLPGSAVTTATNLTSVFYYGADAWLAYKPGGKAGKHVERLTVGGFWMDADNTSNGFESNYALDFISHKVTLSADLIIIPDMRLGLMVYRQQRRGGFVKPRQTAETPFEAFTSADLRCSYLAGAFTFIAEARNLFNVPVMDIGNVQLPGRWLSAGIRVELK